MQETGTRSQRALSRPRSRRPRPETSATRPIALACTDLRELLEYQAKGYAEAFAEAVEAGCGDDDATATARSAWRALLPVLSSRAAVHLYVAAITHGLSRGYVSGEFCRAGLYAAQMALASLTPGKGARA